MARQDKTLSDDKDTTRVQFEMPPRAMERLRTLKDKTEAGSYAEVFRNAMRFYEFLIEQAEQGKEVYVEDEDGKKQLLVHH